MNEETLETIRQMNEAADIAENELQVMLGKDAQLMKAVQILAIWWKKHYMKAGHKRLGRIIAKLH